MNHTNVRLWAPILFPKDFSVLKEKYDGLVDYMTIEHEYQQHKETGEEATSFETFIESCNLSSATKGLYLSLKKDSNTSPKDMNTTYRELRFSYRDEVSAMARANIERALRTDSTQEHGVTTTPSMST